MYVKTVVFTILPQYTDAFREAIVVQATNSLEREAGCVRFDVSEAGNLFFLYEVYADKDASAEHMKTRYFAEYSERIKDWVEDKKVAAYAMVHAGP